MHRRAFLSGGMSLAGSGWAYAAAGATDRRLIVVFLRGAIDGLSVVVPHGEAAYYRSRPRIAIPRPGETDGVLNLDGRFGLHPALDSLLPLWQQGSLAFVQATGSPDPTRSHFDAQDYMERGTLGSKRIAAGWLNRLVALMGNGSPLQAVSVGAIVPRIFAGPVAVATVSGGRGGLRPQPLDRPRVASAFDRLYGGSDLLSRTYREGRASRELMKEALNGDDAERRMADNGAPAVGSFARDAGRLAQLMATNPKVQIGFLSAGGWDTHVNQGGAQGQLANRLQQLGKGLATLAQGLGPVYTRTAIVVLSEFGRTVRENGNGGTDHGHGNAIWLLGGGFKGGKVYGTWPGLDPDQLYEGRDLAVTTDFRDVLVAVLVQQFGLNAAQLQAVFPDFAADARRIFV